MKSPLNRRIGKELAGEWKKYLMIFLFLSLVIGLVSGCIIANTSMLKTLDEKQISNLLENGHFILEKEADKNLLAAIESGKTADIKTYYLEQAEEEFAEKFKSEFSKEFENEYRKQAIRSLKAQGMDEAQAETALKSSWEEVKSSTEYKKAYQKAYDSAYDEGLKEVKEEVEKEADKAIDDFSLDDTNFDSVPVTLYQNFYKNTSESNNKDLSASNDIRVFVSTDEINLADFNEGNAPASENEIAIDRMYAANHDLHPGDSIWVSEKEFTISGLLAYPNYSTLYEDNNTMMFDALTFDVAMVTDEGFERIEAPVVWNYAWMYQSQPEDETQENEMAEDFMRVVISTSLVHDNQMEDFLPRYLNQAVIFAPDDIEGDQLMIQFILYILVAILAFIFALSITSTLEKESRTIGTLRASGYTKNEILFHYLMPPVITVLGGALVGNLLGYTYFKYIIVNLYYNSYSLPPYQTFWSMEALWKTTLLPCAIVLLITAAILFYKVQYSPLQFLRKDFRKHNSKKALRLSKGSFLSRFRIRIIFQNALNYIVLFLGILFVATLLNFIYGMPDTLHYYSDNIQEQQFARYQYIVTPAEEEIVTTDDPDAEEFLMQSLYVRHEGYDDEISVYGIEPDSEYVEIDDLDSLKGNEVILSANYAEKYQVGIGDTIELSEKYKETSYPFKIAGIYEKGSTLSVFMPADQYREIFGLEPEEFTGFFSNHEIKDLDQDEIVTVITEKEITKMADQLIHSMGGMMEIMRYGCLILVAILIYLLTKTVLEKNEKSISLLKILGFENTEIGKLYLVSTTLVVIVSAILAIFLGSRIVDFLWKTLMRDFAGWFSYRVQPVSYLWMFLIILAGYLIVVGFDYRRIMKIQMDQALKDSE